MRAIMKFGAIFASLVVAVSSVTHEARAQWTGSLVGSQDYLNTANWNGGIINNVVTGSGASAPQFYFTADYTSPGLMQILPANDPGGSVIMRGQGDARTLTLGGNFEYRRVGNGDFEFGSTTSSQQLNVNLGGTARTFTRVSSARHLIFRNDLTNGSAFFNHSGGTDVQLEAATTLTGTLWLQAGAGLRIKNATSAGEILSTTGTTFLQGASATALDAVVRIGPGVVQLGDGTGNNDNRLADNKAVYLSGGGALGLRGVNSGTTTETIAAKLTGFASLVADPGTGTASAVLTASTDRSFRGLLRVAGTGLAGSGTATSQIKFTETPTVVGGGGAAGSTTISIVPWLTSGSQNGAFVSGVTATTATFVTYDSTLGVRPLDVSTEFNNQTSFTGIGSQDNVRLSPASNANLTLGSDQTLNSLLVRANGGLGVNGSTRTLTVTSGLLGFAPAGNAITWSISNVAFGAAEGIVQVFGSLSAGGGTTDRLVLNSVLTGDKGVTFRALRHDSNNGHILLGGSSTYSGTTTIAYGRVMTTGSQRIPDASVVSLGSYAVFSVGGTTSLTAVENIGGLAGSGTLQMNNNTASRVIIGSGAGTDGRVTMDGGSLAPGLSIGTLTIGTTVSGGSAIDFAMTGGTLDFELGAGGTFDQLVVSGNVFLGGGTFALSYLDGYTPSVGSRFPVISAASITDTNGGQLFDTVSSPSGLSFEIDGGTLYAVVVPEPGTLALVSAVVPLLLWRRRKARK